MEAADYAEDLNVDQGKEKARQFLLDNPDVAAEIEANIREKAIPMAASGADEETPVDYDA